MNKIKVILLLGIGLIGSQYLKAQSGSLFWEDYFSGRQIKISTAKTTCPQDNSTNKELKILVKIENTSSIDLKLTWDQVYRYNDRCINCGSAKSAEYHNVLVLKPHETLVGTCDSNGKPNLSMTSGIIFGDNNPETKLIGFSFDNLSISKIKANEKTN